MMYQVKDGKEWVRIDVGYVRDVLKRIWETTGERDFGLALVLAESYGDYKLREDIALVKKLIQLEASGFVHPPLKFVDMYAEVRATA